MNRPGWARTVKITLGVVLLPLGIAGLFLPVLQGVLFLVLGLALLASEIPWLKRWEDVLKKRHPEPWNQAERLRSWLFRRFRGEPRREQGPRL